MRLHADQVAEATARRKASAAGLDRSLVERYPMRPVLVGQAPGYKLEGWPPLSGAVGNFLGQLAGVEFPGASLALGLMLVTERHNLIQRWPGRAGQGDAFPMPEAREGARLLLDRLDREGRLEGRSIVLCGRKVADAFGYREAEWFAWRTMTTMQCSPLFEERPAVEFRAAAMPHPSGSWNEPEHREAGRAFLSALLLPEIERISRERGDEGEAGEAGGGRVLRREVLAWRRAQT